MANSLLFFVILMLTVHTFSQIIPGECQKGNATVFRYEVLPGAGWDNLKNENKGRVVQFAYTSCQISDDGTFLIPDGVLVVPVKSSDVERYSKYIDHVTNATSDTAVSINLDATIAVESIPVNGKFSFEFQKLKSNMINDNSIALKTKAHYVQYNAKMQPGMALDSTFKARLLSIANHILDNRTSSARYESQLLVRDFGTNVITSIDAGASIVKVDHVKRSLFEGDVVDKYQISAAAGIELFGVQVGVTISQDVMTKYLAAKTHSTVRTNGGPIYRPVNFTLNDWVDQIDNNLVPVDRSGDPLHFVINEDTLPELSIPVIRDISSMVETAIRTYYKLNTKRGCTDRDSPNFDYFANVDDGTCEHNLTSTNFGGVFQTCNVSGNIDDICVTLFTKNPLTGDFSCPTGFEAVPLFSGRQNKQAVSRTCSSYLIFWKHCETSAYYGTATYQSFWCAAREQPSNTSGYLFGGLYTSQFPNAVTQQKSCPQYFNSLSLAENLNICVSDDFENGFINSVPFNGFFSCQHDNPLANLQNRTHCQAGFSQHVAIIAEDCEINFCARFLSSGGSYIPIRSPPFSPRPSDHNTSYTFVVSNDGQSWTKIYAVPDNFNGFNGTNSSWIINSGDFLDNHYLLMARDQDYRENPEINSESFQTGRASGRMGSSRDREREDQADLSTEQIIGVIGGSVGITLFFAVFVAFVVYMFPRGKKVQKSCDGYTKMKA